MQHQRLGVRADVTLGKVELRAIEQIVMARARHLSLHLVRRQAWELLEEFPAALAKLLGNLRSGVAEVEKQARRGKLLSLKQQRRRRAEQKKGAQARNRPGVVLACSRSPRAVLAI